MLYRCNQCNEQKEFLGLLPGGCIHQECGGVYKPTTYQTEAPADDIQIGGDHYKTLGIQPWEVMKAWASKKEFVAYLWLTSIKYLARWQRKNGVEDLRKARHYIDKLIEELDGESS